MLYLSNPATGPATNEVRLLTWFVNVHYLDDFDMSIYIRSSFESASAYVFPF